jgi:7-cyano-7-deazaguanine synthase
VTYVPARNTFMLGLAASFAESVRARQIWVGFNQLDDTFVPAGRLRGLKLSRRVSGEGYPDCSDEFVDAMNALLALGMERPAKVVAPIIDMTKREIVREALWLKVPIALTWSCYAGGSNPCSRCDACRSRVAAFASLCKPDPAQLT